jgi:hypothetical protein
MLELVREIQGLLEEEVRDAVASGWAEMRVEESDVGLSLHLEPVKLSSAPLEIYFDSAELVICSPGRKGISVEIFSEEPGEVKGRVQALAAAVVRGHYVERLREGTSEIVAEWPGPEGKEKVTREALSFAGAGGGRWRTIAYEPY